MGTTISEPRPLFARSRAGLPERQSSSETGENVAEIQNGFLVIERRQVVAGFVAALFADVAAAEDGLDLTGTLGGEAHGDSP